MITVTVGFVTSVIVTEVTNIPIAPQFKVTLIFFSTAIAEFGLLRVRKAMFFSARRSLLFSVTINSASKSILVSHFMFFAQWLTLCKTYLLLQRFAKHSASSTKVEQLCFGLTLEVDTLFVPALLRCHIFRIYIFHIFINDCNHWQY